MKLSQKAAKRLVTSLAGLFTGLIIVAVIFIGGMVYLSGDQTTNHINLAKASSAIAVDVNNSSTNSFTTIAVNTTSSQALPKTEISTTTPLESTGANVEAIATTTQPAQVTAPTSTPAPAITPATSTSVISSDLPYSIGITNDSFADGDGWMQWWGYSSQTGGVLTIGANATGTSGGTFFMGSYGWSDYTLQATIDWVKGQTFDIVARYESDQNYVECEFGEQQVGLITMNLKQYVNGKETTVAYGSISNYEQLGGAGIPVAMEVQGSQGSCALEGHAISTVFDENTLVPTTWGAVGFETWDPTVNNSEIVVHSVGVVPWSYNLQTYGAQTNY